MLIWEVSIIIILVCQKLGPVEPVQQKIKLPLPNPDINNFKELMTSVAKVICIYTFFLLNETGIYLQFHWHLVITGF